MSFDEYHGKITLALDRAYRISDMRIERAKEACRLAGLDPNLAGIHSQNAMADYEAGEPWPHVDYHYVRLSLCLQRKAFEGIRICERLHSRLHKQVKGSGSNRIQQGEV